MGYYIKTGKKAHSQMVNTDSIFIRTEVCLICPYSQNYGVSSSHGWMWKLDHKEGWIDAFELWCWRRLLRVPWRARRSNQWILKEINSIYIGRTAAEAKAAILWPPDAKSWLIGKYPDAGKYWGQEEERETEDEMVRWYHQLNGH